MTDSRAALGSDRLPWLADEPKAKPAPARASFSLSKIVWPAAAAGMLVVAAGSYWLGTRSADEQSATGAEASRTVVAPLPQARTAPSEQQLEIAPPPEVEPAPAPEVRSTPQREVRIERPRPVKRIIVENPEAPKAEAETADASSNTTSAAKPAAPATAKPLKAWPASQSQGATGRIVRVGAFGTRQKAKLGWRYMVRAYPAVAHLKATVVGDRNSRGRHFYRFQIGTTSQAHSEVLCQRMERIHLSCAVVGLAWRPKGVER